MPGHGGLHRLGIGHVRVDHDPALPLPGDACDGLRAAFGLHRQVHAADVGPELGQSHGQPLPDAAAGARDEGAATGEVKELVRHGVT
jgi:hypothetical protein